MRQSYIGYSVYDSNRINIEADSPQPAIKLSSDSPRHDHPFHPTSLRNAPPVPTYKLHRCMAQVESVIRINEYACDQASSPLSSCYDYPQPVHSAHPYLPVQTILS